MSFKSDMEKYRNPSDSSGMSVCWGDSYYYASLVRKYGREKVEEYLRKNPFIREVPKSCW